jgi:hypothetical protein
MNEMAKNEKDKWDKVRAEKLKKTLEKTIFKHEGEKSFFYKKNTADFNEAKKSRATETEK